MEGRRRAPIDPLDPRQRLVSDVVLYATDTMADWEYGHLLGGLALADRLDPGRFRAVTAGSGNGDPVRTVGGLAVRPSTTLAALDPERIALLVLPGARTWGRGHQGVLGLARQLLAVGTPVAAIGEATLGLARTGVLNDRAHTGRAVGSMAAATAYAGADHWTGAQAVEDRDVITSPGSSPVSFARAVFARLHLFPPVVLEAWYGLHTTGEQSFADRLTAFEQQRST